MTQLKIGAALLFLCTTLSPVIEAMEELSPQKDNSFIVLSLSDAEEKALGYSYDLRSVKSSREVANGRIMQAWGEILPSLTVSGDKTYKRKADSARGTSDRTPVAGVESSKNNTASAKLETYNWSVSSTQPIYTGGRFLSGYRGAKAYRDSVEEDIRKNKSQIIYEVRKEYYDLLLKEAIVRIRKTQVSYAKEFYSTTKARFEAGDAIELDLLRRKVELTNEKSTLSTSVNNLDISRARFLLRLGLPMRAKLRLTDKLTYTKSNPGSESELMASAIQNRAEIAKSLLDEEQRKQDVRKTLAGLFPQLNLVAAYSGDTEDFSWDGSAYAKDWSVGLRMDWNLFDRLLVRGAVREAKALLEQQRFSTLKLKDDIRLEVRMACLNLYSSMERVLSEQENVAQAKRVQDQQMTNWKEGAGDTYLDVLEARKSFAVAEQNYYTSLKDYNVSLADLRYALGEDFTPTRK